MAAPRTSQFNEGLSSAEAMAACGPTAAIAFAQTYGRNPTVGEAMQLARSVGWNPQGGMAGPASEQKLLSQMGVDTNLTMGADWNQIAQEAQTGNPVIISTPGHYFYADGYNAANGTYHVGTSGTDLKNGSEWMTPNQMQSLMGTAQATLYANHPLEGQSIATQQQPITQNMGYQSDFQKMMGIPGIGASQVQSTPIQAQQGSTQGIPPEFANKPYVNEAYQAAVNAGIDPNIFLRQINQESGFNPNAGSSAGAQGIAQIVPKYHPGVNTADPVASLNYAANLDKQLLGQYGGDYTKAMVAYNGGQGAVDAWNSGQPYGESQQYVNAILSGQTPQPYSGQGQTQTGQQQTQTQQQPNQPANPILHRLFQMGGLTTNPIGNTLNSSYATPSVLATALNNPYSNAAPPSATPNPMNLFSTVFTGQG